MNKLASSVRGDVDKYIMVGCSAHTSSSSLASEERVAVVIPSEGQQQERKSLTSTTMISCASGSDNNDDVCHLQEKKMMMKKPLVTSCGESSPFNKGNKKKRRVRFSQDTASTGSKPLFEVLTDEICGRLWFTPLEVSQMRTHIRKLILFGITQPSESVEEYCGLERFTDFERSKKKRAAVRFVLLAQQKGCTLDLLQQISSAVSQDTVTEATIQGFHDFCQVYDPLEGLLGSPPPRSNDDNNNAGESSSSSYNETFFGDVPQKKRNLPLIQPQQPQQQQQPMQQQNLQEALALPCSHNNLCNMNNTKNKRQRMNNNTIIPPTTSVLPITGNIGCLDDTDAVSGGNVGGGDPLLGKRRRIIQQQQYRIL